MDDKESTNRQAKDIAINDYVVFTRVIDKDKWGNRRCIRQGGRGIVLKVNKSKTRIKEHTTKVESYVTAKVDAGPWMGVVTAVLDDAIADERWHWTQEQMVL